MDIEKLIERLKEPDCDECTYEEKRECAGSAKCVLSGYAAEALSTLQAENEKLREKIEDARLEGYAKGLGEMSEENEKLREELEKVKEDWSTAVNGLVLMQKKLNKVYRMLYDPLIIVDGGHLRPVKNTSRQQVYKKLVDLQVEMGINRGFPWGEMRMEKKED